MRNPRIWRRPEFRNEPASLRPFILGLFYREVRRYRVRSAGFWVSGENCTLVNYENGTWPAIAAENYITDQRKGRV